MKLLKKNLVVFGVIIVVFAIRVTISIGVNAVRSRFEHRLGLWRDVRLVKEMEKQQEITEIHNKRPFDVLVADLAMPALLLDQISHYVDVYAKDHLGQLGARDRHVDPFGNLETERAEAVIRVHDGMYCVVHEDEPAARGGKVFARKPAVDEHGGVVVPVQEDELLFPQNYEQSVDQLGHFAQDEQPRPATAHAVRVISAAV